MAKHKPSHQAQLDSFRVAKQNQQAYFARLRRRKNAMGAAAVAMVVIACALIGGLLNQGGIA